MEMSMFTVLAHDFLHKWKATVIASARRAGG